MRPAREGGGPAAFCGPLRPAPQLIDAAGRVPPRVCPVGGRGGMRIPRRDAVVRQGLCFNVKTVKAALRKVLEQRGGGVRTL